jgi:streptogramin lyase
MIDVNNSQPFGYPPIREQAAPTLLPAPSPFWTYRLLQRAASSLKDFAMQPLRLLLVLALALTPGLLVAGPNSSASASSPMPSSCPTPIIEYTLPEPLTGAGDITAGSDGNIYFTAGNGIWRVTPDGQFSVLDPNARDAGLITDITSGSDGNLWFIAYPARSGISRVGRLTLAGERTTFALSTSAETQSIVSGPDGNLWFTIPDEGIVGRVTPQGAVTEFVVGPRYQTGPYDIAPGPDGNLWFTNAYTTTIRQITPNGELTSLIIQNDGGNQAITPGSDGNLWVAQPGGGIGGARMIRLTPSGDTTEFPLPYGGGIFEITLGADGNIWFPTFEDSIGRITPEGTVTEVPLPRTNNYAIDITAGPDGNIWFTEANVNQIGKVIIGGDYCALLPLVHRNVP